MCIWLTAYLDLSQVIDKAFAETWAKKEKLLGNDVSHEGVSNFYPQSPSKFVIQKEILLLLMSALKMPTHNMTISGIPGEGYSYPVDQS